MQKKFLEVGEVVTSHALTGEVRIYPWCDSPDFLTEFEFLYLESGKVKLKVENARVQKNVVVIKFDGYNSVEDAVKLRKKVVYIDRNDVPLDDGVYFVQDIIGLEVIDANSGVLYGKITNVTQTGANDVYHITKNGKVVLIPAIPDVIVETDIEGGLMKIVPLNGLFEPEELHGGEKDDAL